MNVLFWTYEFLEGACERVDDTHVSLYGELYVLVAHIQDEGGWIVQKAGA